MNLMSKQYWIDGDMITLSIRTRSYDSNLFVLAIDITAKCGARYGFDKLIQSGKEIDWPFGNRYAMISEEFLTRWNKLKAFQ